MPTVSLAQIVRAVLVWLLLMAAESAQGALRRWLADPAVDFAVRQAGVLVGVVLIFGPTWLTFRWLRIATEKAALGVGLLWVSLTGIFEIGLGRATGASWSRIGADYDLAHGGLMGLGLTAMALTPWAVLRLRGTGSRP